MDTEARLLESLAEAHALILGNGSDGGPIAALARLPATVLHPDDNVRRALDVFGASQTDTLVVTARGTEQVLGTLSEAYAARRYAQETNLAMRGVLGGG